MGSALLVYDPGEGAIGVPDWRAAPATPPASQYAAMSKTICLIGAPTDVGASVRGAGMGPDALRVAGLAEALHSQRYEVLDRGNLTGPHNPWQPASNGVRHLDEVVAWNWAVYGAVDQALAEGH